MASTFTTNRHLEKPAHNDDIDTWEIPVNTNMNVADSSLGGVTSINVTAVSGTVTLSNSTASPPSYICPIFKLSGTLTANVNYQFPSGIGGNYTVFNNATGAFTITFSSAGGGSSVVVAAASSVLITVDGTNVLLGNTAAVAGATTQIIYNNAGLLAGSANLTFDGTNVTVAAAGYVSSRSHRLTGSTSGYIGLKCTATGGSFDYILPGTDGSSGAFLTTDGAHNLSWSTVTAGVTSFSAGTTGLTPSTGTTGAVTLAGTLAVANGGTGSTTASGARSNLGLVIGTDVPAPVNGTGASGTWGISISGASTSCSGNAATSSSCSGNAATSSSCSGNAATATTATTATTANAVNSSNTYTAVDFIATSDVRLKDVIRYITGALDKVDALNGFYYRNNALARSLGQVREDQQVGLSAQALQAVLPEAVSQWSVDDRYLAVAYDRVIPLLVEAIKELRAEVKALRG